LDGMVHGAGSASGGPRGAPSGGRLRRCMGVGVVENVKRLILLGVENE
jgi:hypothetical protein